jgi:hypothetical protein
VPFTGETLIEIPSIAGTPIPGATRIEEPTAKLLGRYGLLTYRGPRHPIAGYPSGEAPDEITHEWEKEFGKARSRIFSKVIPSIEAAEMKVSGEDIKAGKAFYESVRKVVQNYDSIAARYATDIVNARHLRTRKPPRQPSLRERRAEGVYR